MADVYPALAHSELALKISTHRQSVSPALGGLAKKELVEKRGGRAVALLRSRSVHFYSSLGNNPSTKPMRRQFCFRCRNNLSVVDLHAATVVL